MMKRRIFPWMGLLVLFVLFIVSQEINAQEIYKVKRGDTLARIAKKYGVSQKTIKEVNGLKSNAIKLNQALVIPQQAVKETAVAGKSSTAPAQYYTVKKGDNLGRIARKTGVAVSELRERNNLRGNTVRPGQRLVLAMVEKTPEKTQKDDAAARNGELEEEEDGGLTADQHGNVSLAEVEKEYPASAEFLGKWHNPEERRFFVKVATAFLGAPYRLGGVSVRGLDCSAFVKKIYQLFDVSLPRTASEQARVGVLVARDDLIEGDLVFFHTKRAIGHVGIYIGNNKFVHASSRNKGVRIDSLTEPYFNKRFVKAVRLKGMDEGIL